MFNLRGNVKFRTENIKRSQGYSTRVTDEKNLVVANIHSIANRIVVLEINRGLNENAKKLIFVHALVDCLVRYRAANQLPGCFRLSQMPTDYSYCGDREMPSSSADAQLRNVANFNEILMKCVGYNSRLNIRYLIVKPTRIPLNLLTLTAPQPERLEVLQKWWRRERMGR